MKVIQELSMNELDLNSSGRITLAELTDEEISAFEQTIDEEYPEGISETELTDIICYDDDTVALYCGYSNWDELMAAHGKDFYYEDD